MATPLRTSANKEETFRSFTAEQGQHYARIRPDYDSSVYACILERHTSTGGQLGLLIDLGCGPGMVARALAGKFAHAVGVDPAPGMIETARSLGGSTASGEPIRYFVGAAETLGTDDGIAASAVVEDGTVDLIMAANSAHWFDLPLFWRRAAELLRPGGSVALFTPGSIRVHPKSVAGEVVQAYIDQVEDEELDAFLDEGNRLVRDHYRGLILPWTPGTDGAADKFDEAAFYRRDWQEDESFVVQKHREVDMDFFESLFKTTSVYVRWCEAHPGKAGTKEDVIRRMRRGVEDILHAAGVEEGKERLMGIAYGTVLVVKRQ